MNPVSKLFGALLLIAVLSAPASATEIVVAAASDLNAAAKELIADFQNRTGHSVKLTLGSSGTFHAQIVSGAPFDVFLSADLNYVRDLEKRGLADSKNSHTYAIGRIVLWVPNNSPIDVQALGMKALLQASAHRIAIANPDHAPYGRAAVAAMQKAGIYDMIKSRLVLGENISQTAQFIQSGAADIGIVALSLAAADPLKAQGKYWQIPVELYPPIEQGAVLLKHAEDVGHAAASREFLDMLRSNSGRAILQRYGFGLPESRSGR